jgi:hypothetical protein
MGRTDGGVGMTEKIRSEKRGIHSHTINIMVRLLNNSE